MFGAALRAAFGATARRAIRTGVAIPIVETYSEEWGGNTTTRTVTKPPGTVQNDLLWCWVSLDESGSGGQVITPPSDTVPWVEIDQGQPPSNQMTSGLFYKIAGASEPASYMFTNTSSELWGISLLRISGVDLTNPINAFSYVFKDSGDFSGGDKREFLEAVTGDITNCLLLHFLAAPNDFAFSSPPFFESAPPDDHDGEYIHNRVAGGTAGINYMTAQEDFASGGGTGTRLHNLNDSFGGTMARSGGLCLIAPPEEVPSFLLLEDGTNRLLFEDSSGVLLLE